MLDWHSLLIFVCSLPWMAVCARRIVRSLHILQLEEYETTRFLRWVTDRPDRLVPPALLGAGGFALVYQLLGYSGLLYASPIPLALLAVLWGAGGVVVFLRQSGKSAKKPLVATPRLVLIWLIVTIIWLVTAAIPNLLNCCSIGYGVVRGLALADTLAPAIVVIASLVLYPFQWIAKTAVVWMAASRIRRSSALAIGITGSFGKTSTKEILASLLSAKYETLKTPSSFNTPLGISRVILRALKPAHQMFVVEMGAYHVGDIRGLASLSRPRIGILTAVNPQHLERFGTLDNIAKAKYELMESLPPGGTAIFNNDNDWCRQLAARADSTGSLNVVRFGLEQRPDSDVTATDLRVTRRGVGFRLVARGHGETEVQIGLLGRHSVLNFLAASSAAIACGMTLTEIAGAAARIQPVPHRLQLIEGAGGVTVIDDAYNANPDGARAALEVLGGFAPGRRILVTPGLVELGEREALENRLFGEAASAVCDTVILVGPRRTAPIHDGLIASGFGDRNIIVVGGIGEVQAVLQRLARPGDVVLFENDLPDNYNE